MTSKKQNSCVIPSLDPLTRNPETYVNRAEKKFSVFLTELARYIPADNSFPPLRLAALDDGSVLLEWTFKDRRLGFTFEADPNDYGWYYVFSRGQSERYESGTMDQLEIERSKWRRADSNCRRSRNFDPGKNDHRSLAMRKKPDSRQSVPRQHRVSRWAEAAHGQNVGGGSRAQKRIHFTA
ncbi:MAG: hypothetical protein FJ145_01405 [Deltaproteobacteria bacterium]|nr:hypothetical protein [Deltaproteobacteria bacterium]